MKPRSVACLGAPIAFVIAFAVATTSCSGSRAALPTTSATILAPSVAKSAVIDGSISTPDGRVRTYHLFVPSAVSGGSLTGSAPLLVALHGGGGSGTQFEQQTDFDGLAEADKFLVVYPDGVGSGVGGRTLRTWNGGDCCGAAARDKVDDVTFIKLLVAHLQSNYRIDTARIFAAGHSNGGIMAYRLACELSDVFAAVGVQSSSLEVATCSPARPVALLHIHGTADQNVPIAGGIGPNGASGVTFNPPISGVRTIAAADGCPPAPTESIDPANADLTVDRWQPCRQGTEVEFVRVTGAPHAWMGHPAAIADRVGTPYAKLDSSTTIWTFLSLHPRTA